MTGEGVGKSRRHYQTKEARKGSGWVNRVSKHRVGAVVGNRRPLRSPPPSPPNPLHRRLNRRPPPPAAIANTRGGSI